MQLPDLALWRQHWPAALLVAAIPLSLPWEALNALTVLIGAIVGGVLLWRQRRRPLTPAMRDLALISVCLLLPCLLSAFDAVNPKSSWIWVATALRLPLLAVAIILIAQARSATAVLPWAAALPVLPWLLDALVQATFGAGLAGAAEADRLSGIFGSDDLKLGPVMALLAPLLLVPLLRRNLALLVAAIALLVVVLLAGARAGWIGLTVALAALACYRWSRRPKLLLLATGAGALLALTATLAGYQLSERFAERVDRTAAALSGDRDGIDHALAGRLPIFATAVDMSLSHPINGVGVRGFRHAYNAHAGDGDPWVNPVSGTGASHPHYLWLEVSAEQGLIGAIGLLLVHLLLLRRWLRSDSEQRRQALAPAIALLILMFPLNTHPALYSSFWSGLWWWLIGLYLALSERSRGPNEQTSV